jgi:DNA polymerase
MPHYEKAHAMRALEEEIIALHITPELAEQAQRLVIGDGNLNADIVFIGEAPGKKEDEQGIPFVGAAGKFLNLMLEEAGMVRNDVYITNIVKYRPPNNRDPKPAEKEAFWPYLLQQLEIIQPKVVITLGRHSMGYFLPKAVIGEVHGQPQQVQFGEQALTVIPLYHPAAALYNGSLRQTLIDDFLKVPEFIKTRNVL